MKFGASDIPRVRMNDDHEPRPLPDGHRAPSREARRQLPRLIWLAAVVAGAALLGVAGLVIHDQERSAARSTAEHTARTYAVLTQSILDDLDRVIGEAALEWFRTGKPSQRDFIARSLQQRKNTNPFVLDLALIDPQGRVVTWTGDGPAPDIQDREYVTAHLASKDSVRHVSPPILSRNEPQRWFFALSRAVRDEQGRLLGIGVAGLSLSALQAHFVAQLASDELSVSLVHRSGLLMFRAPQGPFSFGTDVSAYAPPGGFTLGKTFDIPAGLQGERRAVNVQAIADGELLVAGSSNLDLGLETWRFGMLVALGLWLTFATAGFVILRALHRQHLSEQDALTMYHELFEAAPDAIFVVGVEQGGRRFRYLAGNPALAGTGVALDQFVGSTPQQILPPDAAEKACRAYAECVQRRESMSFEDEFEGPDGPTVWTAVLAPILDPASGQVDRIIGIARDMTERRRLEAQVRHLAHHDPLTGLANRSLFDELFSRALKLAERQKARLALLFVDLDHFKPVNDTHGHVVGDALLANVARRLTESIRKADVAARIGGDEFVVLLQDVSDESDAHGIADKIRTALERPFEVEGQRLGISCSVGIALYPEDGADVVALLRHADQAMYKAKADGRNAVRRFTPESSD